MLADAIREAEEHLARLRRLGEHARRMADILFDAGLTGNTTHYCDGPSFVFKWCRDRIMARVILNADIAATRWCWQGDGVDRSVVAEAMPTEFATFVRETFR